MGLHIPKVVCFVGDRQFNDNAVVNVHECVTDAHPDTVEDLMENVTGLSNVDVEAISGRQSSCIASEMMSYSDLEESNN